MAIDLDVHGNTQPLEAAVQAAVNRIRRTPIKITVDDRGATQPLGNMKRGADEFTKSMEAANARILAFGASMAIINGVADSFKAMVRNMVEVEKAMADINVVMGLSAQNLEKFGDGLFKVAKETGAAFNIAAAAATEYARQGLAVEESLKRTRDALILTRLTGMDSAEAVKSLTAAMNTYGHQIKDTTQLVSKFAAVDVQFAVSAEDFAQAISRTGAAAKDAGVDIDELIGIVTAAQQQTARGGAVIGNSLKTIFTRVGRTDTLNQLENLGIAVRDLEGNTLGAKRILTDLANTFDKLSEAQKAQIAQTVGGVFQINILKAILGDAAKQNGILAKATQISAGATDEAIDKNEQLRNTMAAMATETGLALKELSSQIGEIMLAPGMEKVLNAVKSFSEGVSGMLGDGESIGGKFATGFLKGVGNIITGPGLIGIIAVLGKLMGQAFKFTKESLGSLIGVTSEAQKQKAIQTSLVTLFGQNAALNKEMLRTDISRTEKEKIILGLLQAQTVEANKLNAISKQLASTLYTRGYGPNLTTGRGKAYGHIPNFAHPEREQAAKGGYAAGTIRSMNMPGEGSVIYNSAETVKNFAGFKQPAIMPPQSSKAGKNYQQAFGSIHGFDPYAAGGYVPNFALNSGQILNNALTAKRTTNLTKIASGEKIGGQSFTEEQRNAAATALQRRTGQNKTVAATSDLMRAKFPLLNPGGAQYVLLSASPGPEPGRSSYYVGNKTMLSKGMSDRAYIHPGKFFNKQGRMLSGVNARKVDVPIFTLDARDKDLKSSKNKNYQTQIYDTLKKTGQGLTNRILRQLGMGKYVGKREILDDRDVSAMGGNIFEAVIGSVLGDKAFKDYAGRGAAARIDLPYDPELYKLFGVDKSSVKAALGAEAKISGSNDNAKDAARKFYDMLMGAQAAAGFIPNFANPLSDAIGREKAAGVPVSQIRVGSHSALMSKGNPLGLGVTNTYDEPNGLRDVFGANGLVPNYALPQISASDITGYRGRGAQAQMDENAKKYNEVLKRSIKAFKDGYISKKTLNQRTKDLGQRYHVSSQTQQGVEVEIKKSTATIKNLNAARNRASNILSASYSSVTGGASRLNTKFSNTLLGRGLNSTGGQMGLMMGAPMLAGMLQGEGPGKVNDAQYQAGGALMGVGTGAAIGMMFGPLGAAIGGVVGGFSGLLSASKDLKKAQEEAAKASRESSMQVGADLAKSLAPALSKTNFGRSGVVEFSFGGKQRKIDVDNFNKLSAIDPSKSGGFGMKMGADIRGQMLGGLNFDLRKLINDSQDGRSFTQLSEKLSKAGLSGTVVSKNFLKGALYEKYSTDPEYGETKARDRSEAIKKIEDQILAQMGSAARPAAIKAALDQLPQDMKIQTAALKEGSTAGGRAFKKGDLEYFTPEELKKQIDEGNITQVAKAYEDILKQIDVQKTLNEENNKAIIIQLNLQKAQIQAQRNAADAQLDIKSKYLQQSNMLEMQEKLMGGLMTEQQKAQLSYNKAINKAAEAFEQAEATANATLKTGFLQQIGSSDTLQQALKKSIGSEFEVGSKDLVKDISDKVAGMSANELIAKLKEIQNQNQGNADIQKAINLLMETELQKRTNAVGLAQRQKEIAEGQASSEFKINDAIARRKDILANMKFGSEMMGQVVGHGQAMRGLRSQVGAAERLTALGPGYQTRAAQEDFQMNEKRIQMEDRIKTIRENAQVQLSQEREKLADILMQNQKLKDLQDKKGELSKEDLNTMNSLIASQGERDKALIKIENAQSNINEKAKEEISTAEKLLELEEERLKAIRERQTGPGAFRNGISDGMAKMREQVEYMDYELAKKIPNALADGLATAMTEGLSGAKDIGDALRDAGIGFLQMIQQAMMQKAAGNIVSMLPFSRGGNVRNYSRGGNVPAMVSNGEYVMGKDAVSKYGGSFMHSLNAGGRIPGYSSGGLTVGDFFSQPIASPKSKSLLENYFSKPAQTSHSPQEIRRIIGSNAARKNFGPSIGSGKGSFMGKFPGKEVFSAINPTGGGFMSKLLEMLLSPFKAFGSFFGIPGFNEGGSVGLDGSRYKSGKAYQSKKMSGLFYGMAESPALQDDASKLSEALAEKRRKEEEAKAAIEERVARKNARASQIVSLIGSVAMAGITSGITSGMKSGFFGERGLRMASGMKFGEAGPVAPKMFGKYANGGYISGTPGIDQIPAMLSEGEYVIRASSARQLGRPLLDRINAGKFNDGGPVDGNPETSNSTSSSGDVNIDISINVEKGSASEKQNNSSSNSGDTGSKEKGEMLGIAKKVKEQVLSVIIEEQRPGGLLSK